MGKEIEPRPKRWPRSIGSMMIAEEYGPPPTVKFSTGLSWSTILKMAVLRWLCFELYEKYLRAWDETRKNARKAIAAVIIIAAVFVPSYAFMSRAECAAFPAAAERYPWLTFETYALVLEQAGVHRLKSELVLAVIDAESRGNPRAVSVSGARGLMQVMPFWYPWNIDDLMRPRINVMMGARILAGYHRRSGGNLVLTLRNYERGPGGKGLNVQYVARIVHNVVGEI